MNLQRYGRQLLLPGFGTEAQQKLQQAKVLVIGAGGLGVPVLQYLTGMGVGAMGIADADVVSLSNLHRQVLYAETDVGKPKASVAAGRLSLLNSSVECIPLVITINPENALDILKNYDLIVDATDNFEARYLINDACVLLGKPCIYGAVQQYEGQVSVFNYQQGPTYRCLYPTPPLPGEIPDCNTAGVLGVLPGIIGCRQALEAVKLITGIGKSLSGYVAVYDFLYNEQYTIKLNVRPESRSISALQKTYAASPCSTASVITIAQVAGWLVSKKPFMLLDVREPEEFNALRFHDAHLVPLGALYLRLPALPRNIPWVTVCSRGARSLSAAAHIMITDTGIQVFSMEGGMEQWMKQMGNKYITS